MNLRGEDWREEEREGKFNEKRNGKWKSALANENVFKYKLCSWINQVDMSGKHALSYLSPTFIVSTRYLQRKSETADYKLNLGSFAYESMTPAALQSSQCIECLHRLAASVTLARTISFYPMVLHSLQFEERTDKNRAAWKINKWVSQWKFAKWSFLDVEHQLLFQKLSCIKKKSKKLPQQGRWAKKTENSVTSDRSVTFQTTRHQTKLWGRIAKDVLLDYFFSRTRSPCARIMIKREDREHRESHRRKWVEWKVESRQKRR